MAATALVSEGGLQVPGTVRAAVPCLSVLTTCSAPKSLSLINLISMVGMPVVPEVRRYIQENQEFRVILSYTGSEFKASLGYLRPYQRSLMTAQGKIFTLQMGSP